MNIKGMFDEVWRALPLPGEFDSMDECDQAQWRTVIEMAFVSGMRMALNEAVKLDGDG